MEKFILEYLQGTTYEYNDAINPEIENLEVKGDELKVRFRFEDQYLESTYRTETEYVPLVEMLKDIYSKL